MELSTLQKIIAGEIPASPDEKKMLIISVEREKREADRNIAQLTFNVNMELANVREAEKEGRYNDAKEYTKFAVCNASVRERYEERSKLCEKALKILGAE